MKKLFYVLLCIMIAMTAFAQEKESGYQYYNKGVNIMLEWDATLNSNMKFHGPAFTIGCQANPHIFFGGGIKLHLGMVKQSGCTEITYDPNGGVHINHYNAECGSSDFFWLYVPCLCFKYNMFAMKRVTPYLDTRIGLDLVNPITHPSLNQTTLVGVRIGVREGDFAFNIAAGWSYADMREIDDITGREHSFMLRLGIEF